MFKILNIKLIAILFWAAYVMSTALSANDNQQSFFNHIKEDRLYPTRWDTGTTTITNESRLDIFKKYLVKVEGGIYVGVGSTQNLTMAAWAKSEYIYLIDFTKIVVASNKVHIAFIKESKTKKKYLSYWKKKNTQKALTVIKKYYRKEKDYAFIKRAFLISRKFFKRHAKAMKKITKKYHYHVYYTSKKLYSYVRQLALDNRILAMGGNLNGKKTLISIGRAAKKMRLPIAVLYFSNAEEYRGFWPYKRRFKKNMKILPSNENSIVIRTISIRQKKYPWAPGSKSLTPIGFHYIIQPLSYFQYWVGRRKMSPGKLFAKTGITYRKRGVTFLARPPIVKVNKKDIRPKTQKDAKLKPPGPRPGSSSR